MDELLLTKAEHAYLRHKAWHLRPVWYHYITCRELPKPAFGEVSYLFMGGIEREYADAIVKSYRDGNQMKLDL